MNLLTRDVFRQKVFERDNYKCVICGNVAKDTHHIIERRLFTDGGYYLNNGASVCEEHHILCETTDISVEEIRKILKIKSTDIVVPDLFYDDDVIDKWGNYILPNGTRLKGVLFNDPSVQKILKDKLHLFIEYIKHPRTPHLPWSEGRSSDDRIISENDLSNFCGKTIIVTEKMDGENTTFYRDYFHARSIDSRDHISRHRAKAEWANKCWDIPEGWRFVLENMFARHSIDYDNLESFLYGLFVWNDKNECLSWNETTEWLNLLNFSIPKVLYSGIYDKNLLIHLSKNLDFNKQEGYVIRNAEKFCYRSFPSNVAKFVRKNHVQTKHWSNQIIIPNKLKSKNENII